MNAENREVPADAAAPDILIRKQEMMGQTSVEATSQKM